MDKRALKKEFRASCRREKRGFMKMKAIGTLIATAALIAALIMIYMVETDAVRFSDVIVADFFIIAACFVGMALDIAGDIRFKQEFKLYLLKKEQEKADSPQE